MADLLNLSGQGKGLFALTSSDGAIPQAGNPLSDGGIPTDTSDGPHSEVFAHDEEGSRSFANLVQDQLVAEETSRKSAKAEEPAQQPAESVFYAGEPLTESPLGKYQLTMLDGEALPGEGEGLPSNGNPVPQVPELLSSEQPATLLSDPADLQVVKPDAAEAQLSLVEEAVAAGDELTGLIAEQSENTVTTDDIDLLPAEDKDSVFDDLAFIKEQAVDSGESQTSAAQLKAMDDSESAGKAAVTPEELVDADGDSIAIKNQLKSEQQVIVGEDNMARKSSQVTAEIAAERSRSRGGNSADGVVNSASTQNQENSRLQFASQLAQSSIAESDIAGKSAREGMPQGQVSSQSVSQSASSIEQANATRIEHSAALTERSNQSSSESKSVEVRLAVPFSRKDWNEQLGKQLSFLVSRNMDSAQIQLDPPELGPMQVRISIQQDQVALQFQAQHGMVREALDQSIARLQELFSEEGLDLVSVDVSDGSTSNDSSTSEGESDAGPGSETVEESDEILTPMRVAANSDGKIDYFI